MGTEGRAIHGIFVTGATGFVGGVLLGRLLAARPEATVHCLIRADGDEQLAARRERMLAEAGIAGRAAERVLAVRGDVSSQRFGLGNSFAMLARGVDEIFHVAASTKFDLELDDARAVNLDGARHVLEFARAARGAGAPRVRLHHVSTAYVAGNLAGLIRESEVPAEPVFRNTYEQTKWEAEQLLAQAEDVALTCYRPSIVVGDSQTGRTQHFRVLYDPMRWIYSGKIAVLPCRPEVHLDVVPVDYVCDALLALSQRESTIGETYHLSAGPEGSMAIDELVDRSVEVGNAYHAEQAMEPIDRPIIISPDQVETAPPEHRVELEKVFALGEAVMKTHIPYMITEQLFDTAHTRAALEGSGVACPPLRDYFDRIVRWGVERGFNAG